VIADDTDVVILLLFIAGKCESSVYIRHGTGSATLYHNIKCLAAHLGPEMCSYLPAYHAMTGCDYTQPFFGRSKFQGFKIILKNHTQMELLSSLMGDDADIDQVIDFILHVIYKRPRNETTPGASRYKMLFGTTVKKTKKFKSMKRLPPYKGSLSFAILRANLVTHMMVNCLNSEYEQQDPLKKGWQLVGGQLVPVWYVGPARPNKEDIPRLMEPPIPQSTACMVSNDDAGVTRLEDWSEDDNYEDSDDVGDASTSSDDDI